MNHPVTTGLTRSLATLAFALAVSGAARADAKASEPRGLCTADEAVVFSCNLKKGTKTVSLCAAGKNLAYRFGKAGKIELEFPKAPAPGVEHFKYQRLPADLVVETHLAFENGGARYEVQASDPTYKGQQANPDAEASATIQVTPPGSAKVVHLACGDELVTRWPRLKGVLPPGEFGFE
jgi:hypothetical protein